MDYLISRNAAIQAMLKEQQDDIKEYGGCSIPECFDGDRASSVLMRLPAIDPDMSDYSERLWHLAYERGKNDGIVRCKDCINRPYKIKQDRDPFGFNLNARETDDFDYYCPFMCGDGWYSTMPADDFYCKNGERR